MNWFNQNILYSLPDEICSCADCSLDSSVIQCLNKHCNHDNSNHIPNTLTLIAAYSNELFGCMNEFETKYRKLRHELNLKYVHVLLLKM